MGLVRKIKAGLVKVSVNDFVGEDGNVFFDIDDGVMRLSDGTTPGGVPLSSGGGEGGASTFRQLLDTPSSFTGAAGNFIKVNAQASALEFVSVDLFDGDYNNLTNKPVIPTAFDPSSINQSLLPDTDIAYDLGSATKQWRDLYLSGNTIFLGGATISKRDDGGIDFPANSKVNGRKIVFDIKDLDDVEGRLNGSGSGTTNYNELTNLPVLFSGSYTDLTNKPTIPTDIKDLADTTNLLAGAGGGGSYTLPTATDSRLGGIKVGTGLSIDVNGVVSVTVSRVTSYNELTDTPALFSGAYADLTGLPALFDGAYSSLSGLPTLFSGAYADLTGLPTLVTSYNELTDTPTLFSGAYADLTGLPTLFDGNYNSLTNKPTLLTSYNDLIDTPTTLSSFTNDSGYITGYTVTQLDVTTHQAALSITESQISDFGTYLTTVAFSDLTSKPTTLLGYGITDAATAAQGALADTALQSFTETNDLTAAVVWANVPDANITQNSVTQHQTALIITESQISDLQSYLTSVAFADLTTTPTTVAGYGIADVYTKTETDSAVSTAVSDLVGDAPALLDTLSELADAINDDADFLTTLNSNIALKANTADLTTVATTGSYDDLSNKPDIADLDDAQGLLAAASGISEEEALALSLIF